MNELYIAVDEDLKNLDAVEDNSQDVIGLLNILEHLGRFEARELLKKAKKKLKAGGKLRLVVFDIEKFIWIYEESGEDLSVAEMFVSKAKQLYTKDKLLIQLYDTGFCNPIDLIVSDMPEFVSGITCYKPTK